MEVFEDLYISYYNTEDENGESLYDYYSPTNMTEMKMMIGTRPRYPSNKLTFTIANLTRGKIIRYVDLIFNSNTIFDVDVSLEDSKRHYLNSFQFFWSSITSR